MNKQNNNQQRLLQQHPFKISAGIFCQIVVLP